MLDSKKSDTSYDDDIKAEEFELASIEAYEILKERLTGPTNLHPMLWTRENKAKQLLLARIRLHYSGGRLFDLILLTRCFASFIRQYEVKETASSVELLLGE